MLRSYNSERQDSSSYMGNYSQSINVGRLLEKQRHHLGFDCLLLEDKLNHTGRTSWHLLSTLNLARKPYISSWWLMSARWLWWDWLLFSSFIIRQERRWQDFSTMLKDTCGRNISYMFILTFSSARYGVDLKHLCVGCLGGMVGECSFSKMWVIDPTYI